MGMLTALLVMLYAFLLFTCVTEPGLKPQHTFAGFVLMCFCAANAFTNCIVPQYVHRYMKHLTPEPTPEQLTELNALCVMTGSALGSVATVVSACTAAHLVAKSGDVISIRCRVVTEESRDGFLAAAAHEGPGAASSSGSARSAAAAATRAPSVSATHAYSPAQ